MYFLSRGYTTLNLSPPDPPRKIVPGADMIAPERDYSNQSPKAQSPHLPAKIPEPLGNMSSGGGGGSSRRPPPRHRVLLTFIVKTIGGEWGRGGGCGGKPCKQPSTVSNYEMSLLTELRRPQ